ncbi:hypothetical protein HOE425_332772 [Hoeflea sp. EC-HK425]|nr:hypothetical protein HOE425_332772 [Hoeflea sp. EC-HK425]
MLGQKLRRRSYRESKKQARKPGFRPQGKIQHGGHLSNFADQHFEKSIPGMTCSTDMTPGCPLRSNPQRSVSGQLEPPCNSGATSWLTQNRRMEPGPIPRSRPQDNLGRGRPSRKNIGEGPGPVCKRPLLGPVQTAEAAIEDRRGGIAEILGAVGVGADEGDLLQGQPPDIEARRRVAQPNVDNDAARPGGAAGRRPGCRKPDTVNHKVIASRVLGRDLIGCGNNEISGRLQRRQAALVGFTDGDVCRTNCPERQSRTETDCATTDDQAPRCLQGNITSARSQPHGVPATGQRFGETCLFERHMIGHVDKIFRRDGDVLGKSALTRRHGQDLSLCTEVVAPGLAGPALAAGGKGVDRNPPPGTGAINDDARSLVAKDQGCRATLVMAEIGMHVRAADTHRLDPDKALAGRQRGGGFIAPNQAFGCCVDKRFHLAVYPPSTKRTWPVT